MARSVLDRRNRKGEVEQSSIVAPADSLEMVDSLASSEPLNNLHFFVPSILGNDQGNVLAYGFFARVAEHLLRTLIPAGDGAIQSFTDGGVVGGIPDCS